MKKTGHILIKKRGKRDIYRKKQSWSMVYPQKMIIFADEKSNGVLSRHLTENLIFQ